MNEDYNKEEDDESMPEETVLQAFLTFNTHFAEYIKQTDLELFKRAVDYAKTFTEEDVTGVSLRYVIKEKKNDENKGT